MRVDISKDGGSKPTLFVKLHLLPIVAHMGEPRVSCDLPPNYNIGGCISDGQASSSINERPFAPFSCEELSLSCEFGHDRYFSFLLCDRELLIFDFVDNLSFY